MEEGGGVRVTPLDIFDDVVGDNNDDDHDGFVERVIFTHSFFIFWKICFQPGIGSETVGSGDKRIMLAVVAVPEVI